MLILYTHSHTLSFYSRNISAIDKSHVNLEVQTTISSNQDPKNKDEIFPLISICCSMKSWIGTALLILASVKLIIFS